MILRWMLCFCLFTAGLWAAGKVDVGQFDNPRDLTLKIHDPFAQDNPDLMQPVIGEYRIKILPPTVDFSFEPDAYLSEGLYFKQIGKVIYIDVRQPPKQRKAGEYDLAVSLSVPGEAAVFKRLPRHLIYTDAATDVLLVIDNSRSMLKNDPDGLRYAACENFINLSSLSDKIDHIGAIKFSGSAKINLPWTRTNQLEGQNVKELLSKDRTGNFTNINEALEVAATMFEDSFATEKVLVLLTDGRNEPDRYRDTHKLLVEQGVRVYTVGLSKGADSESLQTIATATGGEYFEAVDDKKLMQIYNRIAQELNDFKLIEQGTAKQELKFPLTQYDEFVDINVFAYPKDSTFELTDSQNNKISLMRIRGSKDENTTIMRVPNPNSGWYKLTMTSKQVDTGFNYDIHTNSKLFLKVFPLEKKYLSGEVVHFAVSLAHRQTPMIKSDIKATLTNIEGNIVADMILYDDGVHGDNHADDGVYCAIVPLDLKEGQYHIEFSAKGLTPSGEDFIRVEKELFYVLEAGGAIRDYFLASVLPLYIDFGHVEQGGTEKANLRLSFEGRGARKITMFPSGNIMPKQGNGPALDWKHFEFPKEIKLDPSQPVVLSLKANVPLDLPVGAYTGSVIVQMGDQQLMIPIDLNVKLTTMSRQVTQKADLTVAPRDLKPMAETPLAPKGFEPLAMRGDFDPKKEKLDIPKTQKAVAFEDSKPAKAEVQIMPKEVVVKPIEKVVPIEFTVTPNEVENFEVEVGLYASCLFEIKNNSAHAGNVMIRLDGFGQLDRDLVELKAGESYDLTWFWEVVELTQTAQPIRLSFYNDFKEEVRVLNWRARPVERPIIFYITVAALALIALVYGILYLLYSDSGEGFVSISALAHLILVILAFYYIMPKRDFKSEDSNIMVMDLLNEPKLEVAETETPPEQPKVEPLPLPEPAPQMDLRPRELPLIRQEASTLQREQVKVKRVEDQAQETELKSIERKVVSEDRTFEKMPAPVDAKPTVMSVNDRPLRRAVLTPKKEEPKLQELQVKRSEEGIYRERRVTSALDSNAPEAISLKSMNSPTKEKSLEAPLQTFEAGDQPELNQQKSKIELAEEIAKIQEHIAQGNVQQARELQMQKRELASDLAKEQEPLQTSTSAPRAETNLPEATPARQKESLVAKIPVQELDLSKNKIEAGVLDLQESIEKVDLEKELLTKAHAQKLDAPDRKVVAAELEKMQATQSSTKALEVAQIQTMELKKAPQVENRSSSELGAFDPKTNASGNLELAKSAVPSNVNATDVKLEKIEKMTSTEDPSTLKPAPKPIQVEKAPEVQLSKLKPTQKVSAAAKVLEKERPSSLQLSDIKRPDQSQSSLEKKFRRTSSQDQLLPTPKPVELLGIEAEKRELTPNPDQN